MSRLLPFLSNCKQYSNKHRYTSMSVVGLRVHTQESHVVLLLAFFFFWETSILISVVAEWTKKWWYLYTMGFYSLVRKTKSWHLQGNEWNLTHHYAKWNKPGSIKQMPLVCSHMQDLRARFKRACVCARVREKRGLRKGSWERMKGS